MKMIVLMPATIALIAATHSPSFAHCPETTGSVSTEQQAGIAKDGTHAPLEGDAGQVKTESSTGTTTTSKEALPETAAKDGKDMRMGESSSLATSGQDVAAQQEGEKTAAATAAQEACD